MEVLISNIQSYCIVLFKHIFSTMFFQKFQYDQFLVGFQQLFQTWDFVFIIIMALILLNGILYMFPFLYPTINCLPCVESSLVFPMVMHNKEIVHAHFSNPASKNYRKLTRFSRNSLFAYI